MNPSCEIAVVDDEPIIGELVRTIFLQAGLEVDVFESAGALLASPRLAHYRTIFMDLSLPDMPGLELVDALARAMPSVHLVILSGHSREVLVAAKWRARVSGIASCQALTKPFSREDLQNAVRLSTARPFSQA